MCFTYNAGRCMMMHCSNQGEPLWILDMPQEKRSQTGPWWGTRSYMSYLNIQFIFPPRKGWLETLNLQQLNGWIRNMANLWILHNGISSERCLTCNAMPRQMHNDSLVRTVTPIVDYGYVTKRISPMIGFQQASHYSHEMNVPNLLSFWMSRRTVSGTTQIRAVIPSYRAQLSWQQTGKVAAQLQ